MSRSSMRYEGVRGWVYRIEVLNIPLLLPLLLALVGFLSSTAEGHNIRRNNEPFFYKTQMGRHTMPFSMSSPLMGRGYENQMTMMVGMCSEDRHLRLRSLPSSPPLEQTITNPTPEQIRDNTINDLKKTMKMEEEDEDDASLMTTFEDTVAANTTNTATTDNEQVVKDLEDTVSKFLSISGINVQLPLDCGSNPLSPVILLPRPPNSYPWIAALGSHEDGLFHYRCTGVVISTYHILTDADCVTSPNINVVLLNVTETPSSNAIVNYVAGRRVHPAIGSDADLLSGHNLGLLELAIPLEFNEYVQPVCLPGQFEELDPNERSLATIIGFDINDRPSGREAGLYRWSSSRTLGSALCYGSIRSLRQRFPETERTTLDSILTKTHICVDQNFELVGKSVVVREDEVTGRVKVIGVGGVANAGKTNPIAYTHIQPHRFWIELVLRKFKKNKTAGRSG